MKKDSKIIYDSMLECVNMLEKDEYGLYKNADNYQTIRDNIIAREKFIDREKLNKIKIMSFRNEKLELLYEQMGEFAYKAFPDATSIDHLQKLINEAKEAKESPNDINEYADCLLSLFAAAYKAGIKIIPLLVASGCKLEVCKKRKWVKLEDGTYQHIE